MFLGCRAAYRVCAHWRPPIVKPVSADSDRLPLRTMYNVAWVNVTYLQCVLLHGFSHSPRGSHTLHRATADTTPPPHRHDRHRHRRGTGTGTQGLVMTHDELQI